MLPRGHSFQYTLSANILLFMQLMQLNESEAVPSPSSVAAPQGCAAQGMSVGVRYPLSLIGDASRKGC